MRKVLVSFLLSIGTLQVIAQCPQAFVVSGGGVYCANPINSSIVLSGSQVGVTYRLLRNGGLSSQKPGTGSTLSFSVTNTGNYMIQARKSGCADVMMVGAVDVQLLSLQYFSVSGGGITCVGSAGVTVSLNDSQIGMNYQLTRDGSNYGAPIPGTGSALTWNGITMAGYYGVTATSQNCAGVTATMNNYAWVNVDGTTPAAFNVSGGGLFCEGSSDSFIIQLSGSQTGVNYEIRKQGNYYGSAGGTGSSLQFNVNGEGIYTILATSGACGSVTMNGEAVVSRISYPQQYSVNGGGNLCTGTAGHTITLSGSQTGLSYQLKYNGSSIGSSKSGTGSALVWSNVPVQTGNFEVYASSPTCGWGDYFMGSVNVNANGVAPQVFTVGGGGSYCEGMYPNLSVTLSNSEGGVEYRLLRDGSFFSSAHFSGGPASFSVNQEGTYTIQAFSWSCGTFDMLGQAVVTKISYPQYFSVSGGGGYCIGGVPLALTLSGSQVGISYQIIKGNLNFGPALPGTGDPLSWNILNEAGYYSVRASNTTCGWNYTMSGSANVYTVGSVPTIFNVSGGGYRCGGGNYPLNIQMSGSESGTRYTVFRDGVVYQDVYGNGSPMSILMQEYGTYTIMANSSCGEIWMNGSAMISSGDFPLTYSVSGGGNFCPGTSGGSITLSGSQTGVNYQLMNGSTPLGTPIAGTGSPLSWPPQTSYGTLKVEAISATTGCSQTMVGSAIFSALPSPIQYTLSGGGAMCAGDSGLMFTLMASELGVSYQLKVNGIDVGAPKAGTGSGLSWISHTTVGTYTVVGTNASGCVATMTGTPSITVNTLPNSFTVTGGGSICAGETTVSISLSGSQTGVNYQLKRDGTDSGSPKAGTGSSLIWSGLTVGGAYTIMAISTTTYCSVMMTGSATVISVAKPTAFNLSGGGTICAGPNGPAVILSGSQANVNYQLKVNGTNIGGSVAGTGAALSWTNANTNTAGTYTVVASAAALPGCQLVMNSPTPVTVAVNPLPTTFTAGGGGTFCAGAGSANISLSGSQAGMNFQYQLRLNGVNDGPVITGSGSALSWDNKIAGGNYTIVATNTTTGCSAIMAGTPVIVSNPLPTSYNVFGGGVYCDNGTGVAVSLSSSEGNTNIKYQLQLNGVNTADPLKSGSGAELTWSGKTAVGTYTVVATNALTGCSRPMAQSATVSTIPSPTVFALGGGGSFCEGSGGVSISLPSSQGGISYKLLSGGVETGNNLVGTGGALNWSGVSAAGTYTVKAVNPSSLCTSNMSGNAVVTVKAIPAPKTLTGGGVLSGVGATSSVQLALSEAGVNYQLRLNGTNTGTVQAGNGATLTWANLSGEGTYTAVATKTSTACAVTVDGMPKIQTAMANYADIVNNYGFQYQYDSKQRMTHKKVPGSGWVYMVYDERDRLVMTQDAKQRPLNKWTFTKYDVLNRPIMTGIYTHSSMLSQSEMAGQISTSVFAETYDANTTNHGYTNYVFPNTLASMEVLTVTYYDSYDFKALSPNTEFDYKSGLLSCVSPATGQYCQPVTNDARVRGLVTGSKVKVLNENTWLSTVTYYDDKARVIQTTSNTYRNGIERTTLLLDFAGKVLASKNTNQEGASTKTIVRTFQYDHSGRLTKTYHSLDGAAPVLIASNKYNELGQLVDKGLHSTDQGTTVKQSVDYRYNIRGWLTSINNAALAADATNNDTNDLFGMNLGYDADLGLGNTPEYNGNISSISYSVNLGLAPIKQRGYQFAYDALNRLIAASHKESTGTWASSVSFHENGLTYDLNGNILSLARKGQNGSNLDVLTYDYGTGSNRSNRLLSVGDSGDKTKGFIDGANTNADYDYDENGNMNKDQNKGIASIAYNYLNLPETVTKTDGKYIKYVYDATGRKLSQKVFDASNALKKKSDYIGEYFYENDTLKFINTEEGRVVTTGTPEYQYHLKDHLGNVRTTFTSKNETVAQTATLEAANMTTETSQFPRYVYARRVNSALFDNTNGAATGYAQRLNGSANERIGLAKSLSVMPGDRIQMEVFAKYVDPNSANWTAALTTLMSQITSAAAGVVIDGQSYATSGSTPVPLALVNTTGSSGLGPKAYLNYIMFDRDYNPILTDVTQTNFVRMTDVAKEKGNNVPHERLYAEITVKQPGYIYIYLSNEETNPVEVYFDDFKVTQIKSPVVQMDEYYPFGLAFNSGIRENSAEQKYKFNGVEEQDELSLNVLQAQYRTVDPAIGRWWQVDPRAVDWESPFSTMSNNPILNIDPLGDTTVVYSLTGQHIKTIADTLSNQVHFVRSPLTRLKNESNEDYATKVRKQSVAFLGSKTVKDMEIIATMANAAGVEIAFVGSIGEDREVRLQALDATGNTTTGIGIFSLQLQKGFPTGKDRTNLFLFGHIHTDKGFEENFKNNPAMLNTNAANREKITATPSGVLLGDGDSDFSQQLPRPGRYSPSVTPAMVVTGRSFTVYSATGHVSPYATYKQSSFRAKP